MKKDGGGGCTRAHALDSVLSSPGAKILPTVKPGRAAPDNAKKDGGV
jgi:hypothetical protein